MAVSEITAAGIRLMRTAGHQMESAPHEASRMIISSSKVVQKHLTCDHCNWSTDSFRLDRIGMC